MKIHVSSYLVFIPTTFIKNGCWWLRQLWSLGVGWQDCQSSPTRTLYPRFCCSSPHTDTSSLHELLNTQEQQFRVLPVAVHLHALPIVCSWFSRTGIFLVSPTLFFLCRFENGVAPSFTHGLICGFSIVDVHAPVGKW